MSKPNVILKNARKNYSKLGGHPGNGEQLLFAFVTDCKGNIISMGTNSYCKTHPTQAKYAQKIGKVDAIYLHAEIDALVKCHKKPYAVFVVRFNKRGQPMMAKPCPICRLAMKEAGVKKVVYTTHDGSMKEEYFKENV